MYRYSLNSMRTVHTRLLVNEKQNNIVISINITDLDIV